MLLFVDVAGGDGPALCRPAAALRGVDARRGAPSGLAAVYLPVDAGGRGHDRYDDDVADGFGEFRACEVLTDEVHVWLLGLSWVCFRPSLAGMSRRLPADVGVGLGHGCAVASVAGVDPMALGLVELVHVVRACAVARLLDVVPVSAAFDAFDDVACHGACSRLVVPCFFFSTGWSSAALPAKAGSVISDRAGRSPLRGALTGSATPV